MAKILVCDRCKERVGSGLRYQYEEIIFKPIGRNQGESKFELCDDCASKVMSFVQYPNNGNSVKRKIEI